MVIEVVVVVVVVVEVVVVCNTILSVEVVVADSGGID